MALWRSAACRRSVCVDDEVCVDLVVVGEAFPGKVVCAKCIYEELAGSEGIFGKRLAAFFRVKKRVSVGAVSDVAIDQVEMGDPGDDELARRLDENWFDSLHSKT